MKSNNKDLYRQIEVCAVALVAVLFIPTNSFKNYSADAASYNTGDVEMMDDASGVYDLSRTEETYNGSVGIPQANAPMVTTAVGKQAMINMEDSLELKQESSDLSISFKALDQNANKEEVDAFLEVWSSLEWVEASDTTISDPEHMISIVDKENGKRDLFYKSDSDRYWLCVEEGPKCYYAKK
ncbi:MAG: hypothetical protein IKL88_03235 [Erysipelotrichales bacterium]|nr:hypothetical protein [Erysipelotrichales bacterium]